MPPTLGKSQVSAVRKQIKLQLVTSICKNQACIEFQSELVTLLTELGTSSNEVQHKLFIGIFIQWLYKVVFLKDFKNFAKSKQQ